MIVLDHNIYFDTTLRKLVFVRTYLPKGILKKIVSLIFLILEKKFSVFVHISKLCDTEPILCSLYFTLLINE